MNQLITVSIIITTFNRKNLLKYTIDSILEQTFYDFELIIVDQFSDYDFLNFIKLYSDPRIKYYQNNFYNNIISVNRNYAIKFAKGEYIAFCDDDDIWLPDKLQKQLDFIHTKNLKHPLLIHSNSILFGENLKKNIITRKKNQTSFNDFICNNQITYSTVLLSRSNYVIFDENPLIRASEDYDLWFNLFLNNYNFFLIIEPTIMYRVSSVSASKKNRELNSLRVIYITISKILNKKNEKVNLINLFISINIELCKYLYNRFKNLIYDYK